MPSFTTRDGTELAYHVKGKGEPLVCLPGGAMRASEYLGELGGLTAHRTLVLLDLRGTGDSAVPADTATYRADHQVADVEALRLHLGLERMDLLVHSASGNLGLLYAAAHPERLRRLVMVTPTAWAVGLERDPQQRLADARIRAGSEPYDTAIAALRRILVDGSDSEGERDLVMPLAYGRWDETARAHAAGNGRQQNAEAAAAFAGPGAFDPSATRAAIRRVGGEVLVLAGELDPHPRPDLAAELAACFPRGTVDVQPEAGHFPWLDDPGWFTARVEGFLAGAAVAAESEPVAAPAPAAAPAPVQVSLREVEDGDLEVFREHLTDPRSQWAAAVTRGYHYDADAFDRHWAKLRANPAVLLRTILADGAVAGHAAVFGPAAEREVTYVVGRAHWGRGIATAALAELIALEGGRPLYAHAAADNTGSLRVLEKCGFTAVGRVREFARARGEEIDVVHLTLG
ncbi:alpha/beta fold hydrolase [Streptomyces sp. NPDC007369]|uniref:alpha/beta fold hydrolase n=1 Tax=Streptomyces sp. NPDC007369 TaxID=3154589 RepID=UPI00340A53D2